MQAPKWFDVFRQGRVTGPIDVEYFVDLPNASAAQEALDFLSDQPNEMALKKFHKQADIERMWKATFRACARYDVPVPQDLKGFANRLGVILL